MAHERWLKIYSFMEYTLRAEKKETPVWICVINWLFFSIWQCNTFIYKAYFDFYFVKNTEVHNTLRTLIFYLCDSLPDAIVYPLIVLFFKKKVLQKLWKILFISSEKLFPSWRYSNVCNFFFFLSASSSLKGSFKLE